MDETMEIGFWLSTNLSGKLIKSKCKRKSIKNNKDIIILYAQKYIKLKWYICKSSKIDKLKQLIWIWSKIQLAIYVYIKYENVIK